MKEHTLKIELQYFDALLSGEKTFEIRLNDRNFQKGDIVEFMTQDPALPGSFDVRPEQWLILSVFSNGRFKPLKNGYVILSLKQITSRNDQ